MNEERWEGLVRRELPSGTAIEISVKPRGNIILISRLLGEEASRLSFHAADADAVAGLIQSAGVKFRAAE